MHYTDFYCLLLKMLSSPAIGLDQKCPSCFSHWGSKWKSIIGQTDMIYPLITVLLRTYRFGVCYYWQFIIKCIKILLTNLSMFLWSQTNPLEGLNFVRELYFEHPWFRYLRIHALDYSTMNDVVAVNRSICSTLSCCAHGFPHICCI